VRGRRTQDLQGLMLPREILRGLTPGAQYCTGIGQRKVHHLPGR
jgi:hypothetical protein